jgi:F-type H+-transporting ATPase subunit gamma
MPLLKLKERLGTVKNLNSIFSALQVVTVVRTKRIKEKHAGIQRYLAPMGEVLKGRVEPVKLDRKILVVITSNRGLCGSFNSFLVAKALSHLQANPGMELVAIGKYGANYFKHKAFDLLFSDTDAVEKPTAELAANIWQRVRALKGEVYIAYNAYKSTILQQPKIIKLYPLPEELVGGQPRDYLLEPDPATLAGEMFEQYLRTRFYQIVLESQMGELGARFMVLNGAVDSSSDMAEEMVLAINKERQYMITRDLIEIVSASEALRRDYE